MVAHNPLFHGRWTLKRFNATVINDIWPEVLFFTLIAMMVSLVSKLTPHKLVLSNALLTVLGTVLGLVISFRTSSAYERYQDGRKMWTNIMVASRNLAQMIWIHVAVERPNSKDAKQFDKDTMVLRHIIEKKSMINLVQAFSVSVKHFLRGEPGVYYQDLYPLICFLPRYANLPGEAHNEEDMLPLWSASDELHVHDPHLRRNVRSATDTSTHHPMRTNSLPEATTTHNNGAETPGDDAKSEASWFRSWARSPTPGGRQGMRPRNFDPEKVLPDVSSDRPLRPARNPPKASIYDFIPLLRIFRFFFRLILRRAKPAGEDEERRRLKKLNRVESNVPLEISLVLSNYTAFLMQQGLLTPALASGMTGNITVMQDTMSNLERIRNTPLPFAYQAHLRMSLWLYLLFLPFQIYASFGYFTIPGTAFASFLLLGFLEIGQEIENPFNYDLNDLDLDEFCLSIQRELHEITTYTNPDPSTFIFSSWNQPFAPADRRSAEEIVRHGGKYEVPHSKDGPSPGMASIRRTLVNSWRDVDKKTRQL